MRLTILPVLFSLMFAAGCSGKEDSVEDVDGDGVTEADGDCDDTVASINPLATDIVGDDVDQNCDGTDGIDIDGDGVASTGSGGTDCDDLDPDVSDPTSWFLDLDYDGYGDASTSVDTCEAPIGYVTDSSDCDDSDSSVSPDAEEVCDGIDNDCDGNADDADDGVTGATSWYADVDADGYGDAAVSEDACEMPANMVADNTDCDDTSADYNPAADESDCSDPNDYNCDGSVGYADADADGYAACEECDDSSADNSPVGIEVCDSVDNDCDGDIDEDDATDVATWYADSDADGYGDASVTTAACAAPSGYVGNSDDCNDAEALAWTGAAESCDEIDNNCDGTTDEGVTTTYYTDADSDGYGDAAASVEACAQSDGIVSNSDDCDDASSSTWPGAAQLETNSGDCMKDADLDGFGDDASTGAVVPGTDCNDLSPSMNPYQTDISGDGTDQNCDGVDGTDGDGDGFASAASGGNDCDDTDSAIVPTTDSDADGFDCSSDCDDADPAVYPGADETPEDGIDQNCDGVDAFYGDWLTELDVRTDVAANTFCDSYNTIAGNLYIEMSTLTATSTSFMDCLESVGGEVYVEGEPTTEVSFANLETIGGALTLYDGQSVSFPALASVGDQFYMEGFSGVVDANSFPLLETVGDDFYVSYNSLTEFSGFPALTSVVGGFYFYENPSLTTISGFDALTTVGQFNIADNAALVSVADFPVLETVVSGHFYFRSNSAVTAVGGFDALVTVNGLVFLESNDTLASISGFNALTSAESVQIGDNELLTEITGFTALESLQELAVEYNAVLDTLSGFGSLVEAEEVYVEDNPLLSVTTLGCDLVQTNTTLYGFSGNLDTFDVLTCDVDGDGEIGSTDCDDSNVDSYNGATEICDGLDNDCDGAVPSNEGDEDGDGSLTCADCDDSDDTRYPGAYEVCDSGVDSNCDGSLTTSVDGDGDGISSCQGDCDDNDAANTTLSGDASCPAYSCKEVGQPTNGAYWVTLTGTAVESYCEMQTANGGWTLYGITDSDECAESLDYGPDVLSSLSGGAYVSNAMASATHTEFLQVFQADGANTDFTIVYTFDSGAKTLEDRFQDATSGGEAVTWTVTDSSGQGYSLSGTWWYTDQSTYWSGTGSEFSDDDGSWGAGSGEVNGNGTALRDHSDSWGHENPNGGDSECYQYWMNGSSYSSNSIRNYMYFR